MSKDNKIPIDELEFIKEKFRDNRTTLSENEGFVSKVEALKEEVHWPDLEEQTKHLKNLRYRGDTRKRNVLSTWAAVLVSAWLVGVFLILIGNTATYKLSSDVLITLLATTTLNVLGLMYIVLKGLFGLTIKRD